MKIGCAWCGKDMGEKNGEGLNGVSHSICEECLNKLKVEAENKNSTESTENAQKK